MIVRVSPSAKRDISEAFVWYEEKREGLGVEFIERVDQAIERIGLNPLGYQAVSGDTRRANIEQFPYSLFFKIKNDVVVVACLHAGRDPSLRESVPPVSYRFLSRSPVSFDCLLQALEVFADRTGFILRKIFRRKNLQWCNDMADLELLTMKEVASLLHCSKAHVCIAPTATSLKGHC